MYILLYHIIQALFPASLFSLCYVILAICFILFSICFLFHRKWRKTLALILCFYCLFLSAKFIMRTTTTSTSIEPELVYCCSSCTAGGKGDIIILYKISRGPVVLKSHVTKEHLRELIVTESNDTAVITNLTDDSSFTYIISFGASIQSIMYDLNEGEDVIPFLPIDGRTTQSEIRYELDIPYSVFVYRIPAVPIDSIP